MERDVEHPRLTPNTVEVDSNEVAPDLRGCALLNNDFINCTVATTEAELDFEEDDPLEGDAEIGCNMYN
jgi:hypothetical protein